MNIIIDGNKIPFTESDKNIVEAADRSGVMIPAPCYRSNKKNGCCKACVVDVDGIQSYACGTKPEDGMNIVLNREDLKSLRKERINEYKESDSKGCDCDCDCSSGTSAGNNCC